MFLTCSFFMKLFQASPFSVTFLFCYPQFKFNIDKHCPAYVANSLLSILLSAGIKTSSRMEAFHFNHLQKYLGKGHLQTVFGK